MSTGFGGPPNNSAGLAQNGIQIPLATETTPGLMSAADKTKLDGIEDGATWVGTRFYAVDFTSGLDTNAGFSDTSMSDAGTVAKKTWAGFLAIFPTNGRGQSAVIAIARVDSSGTTYGEALTLDGIVGYDQLHLVATSNFTDNATDRILSAGRTSSAGPGAGGVWTCAAGATTSALTISAGALPASPAAILKRIRFTGNVTAGLANICATIYFNDATNITVSDNLTLAPANGDTFLIEDPGVLFSSVAIQGVLVETRFAMRGIASAAGWDLVNVRSRAVDLVFCEARGGASSFFDLPQLTMTRTYTPTTGGTSRVGFGYGARSTSSTWRTIEELVGNCSGCTAGLNVVRNVKEATWGDGCVVLAGSQIQACGFCVSESFNFGFVWGRVTANFRDCKYDGANLVLFETNASVRNMIVQNVGGNAAIRLLGNANRYEFVAVTGSTGNTQGGISPGCLRSDIYIGAGCTLSGTSGEISLLATYVAQYADLALSNFYDVNNNHVWGSAGRVVDACRTITNKQGAALAVGEQVRSNGTSNQVVRATGNSATIGDSSHLGVMVTAPADNSQGYMSGPGYAYCLFDGAPTVGAIAYLSPGTAGKLTTTIPVVAANNNKLRVGRVVSASGSTGIVRICPENLAIVADGAA